MWQSIRNYFSGIHSWCSNHWSSIFVTSLSMWFLVLSAFLLLLFLFFFCTLETQHPFWPSQFCCQDLSLAILLFQYFNPQRKNSMTIESYVLILVSNEISLAFKTFTKISIHGCMYSSPFYIILGAILYHLHNSNYITDLPKDINYSASCVSWFPLPHTQNHHLVLSFWIQDDNIHYVFKQSSLEGVPLTLGF